MTQCTVIVPVYNEPQDRLLQSILSARVAIDVAGIRGRIVVVDDGSPVPVYCDEADETITLAPNRGISAALNTAARGVDSGVVCWLSCGDFFRPDKIRVQLGHMVQVGSLASYTDWNDMRAPSDLTRLPFDSQVCGSTVMVDWTIIRRYPFDESLRYCVDWDWACRVQYEGPGWTHVPEILTDSFAYPGGHTDRGNRGRRRMQDRAIVSKRWRRANKGMWDDPLSRK